MMTIHFGIPSRFQSQYDLGMLPALKPRCNCLTTQGLSFITWSLFSIIWITLLPTHLYAQADADPDNATSVLQNDMVSMQTYWSSLPAHHEAPRTYTTQLSANTLSCGQEISIWFQVDTRQFDDNWTNQNVHRTRMDLAWHIEMNEQLLLQPGVYLHVSSDAMLWGEYATTQLRQDQVNQTTNRLDGAVSLDKQYQLFDIQANTQYWIVQPVHIYCHSYTTALGALSVSTSSVQLNRYQVDALGNEVDSTLNTSSEMLLPTSLFIYAIEDMLGVHAPLLSLVLGVKLADSDDIKTDGQVTQNPCDTEQLHTHLFMEEAAHIYTCYTLKNVGTRDVSHVQLRHDILVNEYDGSQHTEYGRQYTDRRPSDAHLTSVTHHLLAEQSVHLLANETRYYNKVEFITHTQWIVAQMEALTEEAEGQQSYQATAESFIQLPLDPTIDSDGDGLSDAEEFMYNSDLLKQDTDQDGLDDYEEIKIWKTKVNDADSDDDGVLDGDEIQWVLAELTHNISHENANDELTEDANDEMTEDGNDEMAEDGNDEMAEDTNDEMTHREGTLVLTPELVATLMQRLDPDQDNLIAPWDFDSDNDGLLDGVEMGVEEAHMDTLQNRMVSTKQGMRPSFQIDLDPFSVSDPLSVDSDGAGCLDWQEDLNLDGKLDDGESDPSIGVIGDDLDLDQDGLCDRWEESKQLSSYDADSDDDGVLDGQEIDWYMDTDLDGLINALDVDSDNDGLFDGTEMSIIEPHSDTKVEQGFFIADQDPSTMTNVLVADSDGGGALDGIEDFNRNGKVDRLETNPLHMQDDQVDIDQDSWANHVDNCPVDFNPQQKDLDQDGIGNACDIDIDSDGTLNLMRPADRGCAVHPAHTLRETNVFSWGSFFALICMMIYSRRRLTMSSPHSHPYL